MTLKNRLTLSVFLMTIFAQQGHCAAIEAYRDAVTVSQLKKKLEDVKTRHLDDIEVALGQKGESLRSFFEDAIANFNIAPLLTTTTTDDMMLNFTLFNQKAKLDYLVSQFDSAVDGYYSRSSTRSAMTSVGLDESHHFQCMDILFDLARVIGVQLPTIKRFIYVWIENKEKPSDVVPDLINELPTAEAKTACLMEMMKFLEENSNRRSILTHLANQSGTRKSRTSQWKDFIENYAKICGLVLATKGSSRRRTPSPPEDSLHDELTAASSSDTYPTSD